MQKFFISSLIILLIMSVSVSCKKANASSQNQINIALITTGTANDKSFNQEAYEEAVDFAERNNAKCKNYIVTSSQSSAIGEAFALAAAEKNNVFILMGYSFIRSIIQYAPKYPDVKFIGIDVNDLDIYTMAEGLGLTGFKIPKNVYCCSYHEHIAGFMAGYAAVKEGYTKLGFLGGKSVPAVIRYGIGYVQGIDLAAREMGISDKVIVDYAYSKSFEATETITEAMRQWFSDGMEVLFPCGGAIWTSGAKAAAEYNGRIIGVDTDQSLVVNTYGQNLCLTSAIKNIGWSVRYMLNKIKEGQFDDFGGKAETLGMVSADNPDLNFLQLPTDTWVMKNFTKDDHLQLVRRIVGGDIKVLSSGEDKHDYSITLNIHPTLK